MAIKFTSASSEYVKNDVQLSTAITNISFGGWFKTPPTLATGTLMYNGHGGGFGEGYGIQVVTSGTVFRVDISFVGNVAATTTLVASTWYHGFATRGATTWRVYLNGVNEATGTHTPFAIGGSSGFVMGARYNTGATNNVDSFWNDSIAEMAFWTRELTAAEVLSLSKGYAPSFYPNGLLFYAPLIRNIKDTKNNFPLTVSGTAASAHPKIIYPR